MCGQFIGRVKLGLLKVAEDKTFGSDDEEARLTTSFIPSQMVLQETF